MVARRIGHRYLSNNLINGACCPIGFKSNKEKKKTFDKIRRLIIEATNSELLRGLYPNKITHCPDGFTLPLQLDIAWEKRNRPSNLKSNI